MANQLLDFRQISHTLPYGGHSCFCKKYPSNRKQTKDNTFIRKRRSVCKNIYIQCFLFSLTWWLLARHVSSFPVMILTIYLYCLPHAPLCKFNNISNFLTSLSKAKACSMSELDLFGLSSSLSYWEKINFCLDTVVKCDRFRREVFKPCQYNLHFSESKFTWG